MSVSIARVPPAPGGGKLGIDDYLARGGELDDLELVPFEAGWLPPKDWPTLADQAMQGLAGEIVRTMLPNTESDPVAILVLFLASYGNMIGRGAHFVVEGDTHYCKIWPILVGESALARKGTAQGRVDKILRQIDEQWYLNCRAFGLSSGEGLIHHVRDRRAKEGKDGEVIVVDEGVADKRVLVTEPEFASPLIQMQREGNVLSATLRTAWDDQVLQTLSKTSPEKVTGSHITICSHTNREELLKHLTTAKLGGGVGNRFLFHLVRRSKKLPHGGDEDVLSDDLLARLRRAINFGREHRHIKLSGDKEGEYDGRSARELWEAVYEDFEDGAAGLTGVVTSRGEAQVRRLATTYAALDRSATVKIDHLLAALSLWEYAKQSTHLIFQGKTGDEIADEILHALQEAGDQGMSRTDLVNHFNRNIKASRIRAALTQLQRDGWARCEKIRGDRSGPPEERWYACFPG
jgi:hypothetical protein